MPPPGEVDARSISILAALNTHAGLLSYDLPADMDCQLKSTVLQSTLVNTVPLSLISVHIVTLVI